MVPVADHAEGVKRLESGEFAAYFADRAILTYLLLGEGAPKTLRISKECASRASPTLLALAHGDDDFRFLVDRTLARIYRSGAIGPIFARSFGKAKAERRSADALRDQRAAGVGFGSRRPSSRPGSGSTINVLVDYQSID